MTSPASAPWRRRHGHLLLGIGLVTVFLLMFLLAQHYRIQLLTDPLPHLRPATPPAVMTGILLLVADVVLPVPSSAVMIGHGAVFGLLPGTLVSLVGGTAATVTAFLLGRRSQGLVKRLVTHEQQHQGTGMLQRHGMWAVVVTRPVPMLAETVAILAGTATTMPWWKVTIAGALGNLVPAVAYAATGAYALTFVTGTTVFLGVLGLTLLARILTIRPRAAGTRSAEHSSASRAMPADHDGSGAAGRRG